MSTNERDIHKPVKSAMAVAALRAASGRESDPAVRNPDYLARHFVGGLYSLILALPRAISRKVIEKISPGSYCYFLARTRFIDDSLSLAVGQGVNQIVILGAGYDSRAHRFAQHSNAGVLQFFEVDLSATQLAKRKRMHVQGISELSNVRYVAHDFNSGQLMTALKENGFKSECPTFFIWEGVSYYLSEAAVVDVFQLLANQCAAGSSLAFDYSLRSFVKGATNTYGGKSMQAWLLKNKERFLFGLEPGELQHYLKAFNLIVTEDLGAADLHQKYLIDSKGRSIGESLGHLRLARAVLAS
jgi:methyltransferase (TIGR00027 family)